MSIAGVKQSIVAVLTTKLPGDTGYTGTRERIYYWKH